MVSEPPMIGQYTRPVFSEVKMGLRASPVRGWNLVGAFIGIPS
jgi:hypothetical protein